MSFQLLKPYQPRHQSDISSFKLEIYFNLMYLGNEITLVLSMSDNLIVKVFNVIMIINLV